MLNTVGHITEGFYDTALNEANNVGTTGNCTKASPRCQTRKVCPKGLCVKTMLGVTLAESNLNLGFAVLDFVFDCQRFRIGTTIVNQMFRDVH